MTEPCVAAVEEVVEAIVSVCLNDTLVCKRLSLRGGDSVRVLSGLAKYL